MEDRKLTDTLAVSPQIRPGDSRGAPSAATLQGLGLEQVYVVVDGFEGATATDNPNGPRRVVGGWKNSGLPWGYEIDPDKIHLRSFD